MAVSCTEEGAGSKLGRGRGLAGVSFVPVVQRCSAAQDTSRISLQSTTDHTEGGTEGAVVTSALLASLSRLALPIAFIAPSSCSAAMVAALVPAVSHSGSSIGSSIPQVLNLPLPTRWCQGGAKVHIQVQVSRSCLESRQSARPLCFQMQPCSNCLPFLLLPIAVVGSSLSESDCPTEDCHR